MATQSFTLTDNNGNKLRATVTTTVTDAYNVLTVDLSLKMEVYSVTAGATHTVPQSVNMMNFSFGDSSEHNQVYLPYGSKKCTNAKTWYTVGTSTATITFDKVKVTDMGTLSVNGLLVLENNLGITKSYSIPSTSLGSYKQWWYYTCTFIKEQETSLGTFYYSPSSSLSLVQIPDSKIWYHGNSLSLPVGDSRGAWFTDIDASEFIKYNVPVYSDTWVFFTGYYDATSGTIYSPGQTISGITQDITLYVDMVMFAPTNSGEITAFRSKTWSGSEDDSGYFVNARFNSVYAFRPTVGSRVTTAEGFNFLLDEYHDANETYTADITATWQHPSQDSTYAYAALNNFVVRQPSNNTTNYSPKSAYHVMCHPFSMATSRAPLEPSNSTDLYLRQTRDYDPWFANVLFERVSTNSISTAVSDDEGQYCKVTFDYYYQRVGSADTVTSIYVDIGPVGSSKYRNTITIPSSSETLVDSSNNIYKGSVAVILQSASGNYVFDTTKTYNATIYLTDEYKYNYSESPSTYDDNLSVAFYTFDALAGGHGLALGRPAKDIGYLDIGFKTRFYDDVSFNGEIDFNMPDGFLHIPVPVFVGSTLTSSSDMRYAASSLVIGSGHTVRGSQRALVSGVGHTLTNSWAYDSFIVGNGNSVGSHDRVFMMGYYLVSDHSDQVVLGKFNKAKASDVGNLPLVVGWGTHDSYRYNILELNVTKDSSKAVSDLTIYEPSSDSHRVILTAKNTTDNGSQAGVWVGGGTGTGSGWALCYDNVNKTGTLFGAGITPNSLMWYTSVTTSQITGLGNLATKSSVASSATFLKTLSVDTVSATTGSVTPAAGPSGNASTFTGTASSAGLGNNRGIYRIDTSRPHYFCLVTFRVQYSDPTYTVTVEACNRKTSTVAGTYTVYTGYLKVTSATVSSS